MEYKYKLGHAFPTEGMKTGISVCGKSLISYTFASEDRKTMTCKDCLEKMCNGVKVKYQTPRIPVVQKKGNKVMQIMECPFCNHDKAKCLSMKRDSRSNPGTNYQVVCNKCKARGPLVPDSEKKAIDLWNRTF